MKVAIVYDRVNKWGGAERMLLVLHELFPAAPLFTSVFHRKKASWAAVFPDIIPSFLQKIAFARSRHEYFALIMSFLFESHDFSEYDLVISLTTGAAKGIITKPETKHICFCLTPTRYLWSHHDFYFRNNLFRLISRPFVNYLRSWDKIAAQRPDVMIGISTEVCKRIKKYYRRESELIFPPVDISMFKVKSEKLKVSKRKDFYLIVNRLVPYKRVDLAIETFNELGLPLVIVGIGSQEDKLRKIAGKNIEFVGFVSEKKLVDYYLKAKALVFPQNEDFGLVAVEAQACGTPVIGYRKGGVLDIIINGKTGVFFEKQEKDSLKEAVLLFNQTKFDQKAIIKNAQKFSEENFKEQIVNLVKRYVG